MTPAEQIAAEVAARYGVQVDPSIVKVLPYRVSVDVDFFWCEKRQALISKEGLSETLRRTIHMQTQAAKSVRAKNLAACRQRQAEKAVARANVIRKWVGDGVTLAALAEHMGVAVSTAEKYAREHSFPMIRERRIPTKGELIARRAKVAELRKQGLSISKICLALNAGSKAIRRDLEALGMAA
jgi:hypothetical protein